MMFLNSKDCFSTRCRTTLIHRIAFYCLAFASFGASDAVGLAAENVKLRLVDEDLVGVLRDDKGNPVSNARVILLYKSWPGGRYRQQVFTSETGMDGKFVFAKQYPLGERTFMMVTVVADGFAMIGRYVQNPEGEKIDSVDFRLKPALKKTFVILNDGKPVSNANVTPLERVDAAGGNFLIYQQAASKLIYQTNNDAKLELNLFQKGDKATLLVNHDGKQSKLSFEVDESKEQSVDINSESGKSNTKPKAWSPKPTKVDPTNIDWVRANAVPFRSVNPNDTDFGDLQSLKKIIGDARIVQLGEQSHGDGTCFKTKIRLIKFLHEEMGFDVLAFESGLYDCDRAWKAFQKGRSSLLSAREGVFGIWTGSRQTKPLWSYISKNSETGQPLEIAGFDCQFTGSASKKYLMDDMKKFLAINQIELGKDDSAFLYPALEKLRDGEAYEVADKSQKLEAIFSKIEKQLSDIETAGKTADAQKADLSFWKQQFKSMLSYAKYSWAEKAPVIASVNSRDAQMADNLIWLAKKRHPNKKIIVWAASFHIARNVKKIEVPDGSMTYEKTIPMGELIAKEFGKDAYTIGFTTYDGKAGAYFRPTFPIPTAPEGTLEDIFNQAKIENGLVPLTNVGADGDWLKKKILSRPLGYKWMKSSWGDHFDAMIFNKTMKPSTR